MAIRANQDIPTSPLKLIEETQWDPLYYLRCACEERFGCGLYTLPLPKGLIGLSCYLADEDVPGTPEHAEKNRSEREMLALLQ